MEFYDRIRKDIEQIQKAEVEFAKRRGNWNEYKELARCNWCSSIFTIEQGFQSSMADDQWFCSVACENQYLEDKEWDNVLFNEAQSLTDEDMAWLTHAECNDPSCSAHGLKSGYWENHPATNTDPTTAEFYDEVDRQYDEWKDNK